MAEMKVPAVVQSQTVIFGAAPITVTSGKVMVTLDIIPGKFQILQVTSRPGPTDMRLDSRKLQSHTAIGSILYDTASKSSLIKKVKTVKLVRLYCCI